MVIDEVRKAVGPRVPISLRLSVDELVEGGNTVEDCLEYLEYLNDEVDIYDTSAGLNASIQYQIDANYLEDGWRSYMAKAVRDKFGSRRSRSEISVILRSPMTSLPEVMLI